MKVISAILLALFLYVTPVVAHSWYPYECCGDYDCAPVKTMRVLPSGDVEITISLPALDENGQFTKKADVTAIFPKDFEQRKSEDGEMHACIIGGKPKCLFIGAGL